MSRRAPALLDEIGRMKEAPGKFLDIVQQASGSPRKAEKD